jgi:hypothetical protein
VAVFAAVASIDEMVDLTNIGTLFAFILVCAGIIVLRVKEPGRERPFRVPGGLVIPVLGIISCLYLIYFLPPTSWLRFAAWLNLGFIIYVGYGSVHSRLTGRQSVERTAEHDAQTAHTGAWLALIGTVLLFLTRGFDIWIESRGAEEQPVAGSNPWLDVSWFLIVPLALNALVLCPIVIRRALRAKLAGGEAAQTAGRSIAIAALVLIASIIYLLMVLMHNM